MPKSQSSRSAKRRTNILHPTRKSDRLQKKKNTNYEYAPLESGQIRVLQLFPGKKGDTFVGKLVLTQLGDQAVDYDALSYLWGDPTPADTIWISGKALPIASNLRTALTHLRYEDKPLTIWIDAICIHQNNEQELAEQVQLMRRLYMGAKMVRIWIDEPDVDSSSEAIVALQYLAQNNPDTCDTTTFLDLDTSFKILGQDPYFWHPVLPLFSNMYWTRAWTQQEILNAADFNLHFRNVTISGASISCFKRAAHALNKLGDVLSDPRTIAWNDTLEHIDHYAPTDDLSQNSDEGQTRPLDTLLGMSMRLGCSKPQDRIYAIMHLADDYEEGGIDVNYSKSVVEVAIDVAIYHVKKHRDVQFLSRAYLRNSSQSTRIPSKPTWLPHGWCGDERRLFLQGPQEILEQTYCFADAISAPEGRLRLRGIRVDRVNACLTSTFDTNRPTASDLWESPLGNYLHQYTGVSKRRLPEKVLAILVGDEMLRDLVLGGVLRGQTSRLPSRVSKIAIERWHKSKDDINPVLYEAIISALEVLLQLSSDPRHKHERLYTSGDYNLALFRDESQNTVLVLRQFFRYLLRSKIIMTERKDLGRITDCDLKLGDEVWVVLGCGYPLILRQLPNGRYWHISPAEIPAIQEHELLWNLSSDIQPGDQIGEWVVEDIELE